MSRADALINPDMLRWARERAGLDVADAAKVAGVKESVFARWESGEGRPTFRQAQVAAHALRAPFGFLFLARPPQEENVLPDLRTVGGAREVAPSPGLMQTIQAVMQRQTWYVEFLQEQGAQPLPFVGQFRLSSPVQEIVASMRSVLQPVDRSRGTWEDYLRDLIRSAEGAGILVMRSGIVGNNTHWKLDVAEFRGFAIAHPLAPVVFINASDAPTARLFTLVHELAHIWIGSSGISDLTVASERREEVLCNAVAGEFLVPAAELTAAWNGLQGSADDRAVLLAQRFRVSRLVVVRRAYDLKLVDRAAYMAHYLEELEAYRSRDEAGGSFYRNAGAKNSLRFARAVTAEALGGRILLRDAGKLLGVQPAKVRQFAEQIGE